MKTIWKDYLPEAVGIYDKRDCPGGIFKCRGSVKVSSDGNRFLFVPFDEGLRAVEAEQI